MLGHALGSGREVTTMLVRFAGLRQVAANMRREDTDRPRRAPRRTAPGDHGPERTGRPARFDGFAVVFAGGTPERRQQIGERIADELSAPISVESREVFVDPRVGITVGLPGEAADAVLAHADHASTRRPAARASGSGTTTPRSSAPDGSARSSPRICDSPPSAVSSSSRSSRSSRPRRAASSRPSAAAVGSTSAAAPSRQPTSCRSPRRPA